MEPKKNNKIIRSVHQNSIDSVKSDSNFFLKWNQNKIIKLYFFILIKMKSFLSDRSIE